MTNRMSIENVIYIIHVFENPDKTTNHINIIYISENRPQDLHE